MLQKVQFGAIFVLACVILGAFSQDSSTPAATTTAAPAAALTCGTAQGIAITQSLLNGTQYVVAASVGNKNVSCWQLEFSYPNATFVTVATKLTNSSQVALQDVSFSATANLSQTNSLNAFNFTDIVANQTMTYKLLQQSGNFSLICGYTDPTNVTTAVAYVLSSSMAFNATAMVDLEKGDTYASLYANAQNITIDAKCYTSSASRALPEVFASLLMMLALLQYLQK